MPRAAFDPRKATAHLKAADPVLGRLMARVGPFAMTLEKTRSTFEALLESIVYQQLNGKAAETILGRLRALFPPENPLGPESVLAMPEEKMRSAGLSRAKTASLKDLAAKTLDGTVPPLKMMGKLSDLEIEERLTQVRGIGPWTVHMLLIFRLGRPDVLPIGDFAVRKAFGLLYKKRGHPKPEHVAKRGERWRPYRSVASWYLWRFLDSVNWD